MNDQERCEVEWCSFAWDVIDGTMISSRILTAAQSLAELIESSGHRSATRCSPELWSPLEYACHVRDVLLNLRDRLIVALNEDNPLPKGLYGTPRIEQGLYRGDRVDEVGKEVRMAASLFVRTWDRIPLDQRHRTMVYGYPTVANRSLTWVAAQALHEVEHHLADIRLQSE